MSIRQGFMAEHVHSGREAFAFAAEHGFDHLELNMEHGFHRADLDVDAVRALADEFDLALLAHLPYRLDAGSPHEHVRDGSCRELEAALDAAAELGVERAVMHAQTVAHEDTWDTAHVQDCILDSVRRVAAYGRDVGVEVCVENLKGAHFDVHDFPALFERTDAAMCLDTGHAAVCGMDGDDQAAFFREHGDRIAHVHLNDSRHRDDDEHLPVGLGTVDFPALADVMVEADWTGTCTHEVYGFDLDYVALGKERFDALLAA
jgi:sugar phosphate isomerase/epimerase